MLLSRTPLIVHYGQVLRPTFAAGFRRERLTLAIVGSRNGSEAAR